MWLTVSSLLILSVSALARLHLRLFPDHRALCDEPKILHLDISQNNIILRRDKEGLVFDIIIDFDLVIVMDSGGKLFRSNPSSYDITRTLPFMAIHRLSTNDQTHWPRHDLESFFWLIVLFTSRHHEGQAVDHPPSQNGTDAMLNRSLEPRHSSRCLSKKETVTFVLPSDGLEEDVGAKDLVMPGTSEILSHKSQNGKPKDWFKSGGKAVFLMTFSSSEAILLGPILQQRWMTAKLGRKCKG